MELETLLNQSGGVLVLVEGRNGAERFPAYYRVWEAPHMKPAPTQTIMLLTFHEILSFMDHVQDYGICALDGTGIVYSFIS